MDSTILAAIITAIGAVAAAFGGQWYKKSKSSKHTTGSGPSVTTGEISNDTMTDSDKNLFALGYYHGNIATRIICRFPKEKVTLDSRVQFALDGLLELIQYQDRAEYLRELTNLLRKVDATVSTKEKKVALHRIGELLSPLRRYIEKQYEGRGNASFVLGMNLPQLYRCITIFKVIDEARKNSQVTQAELTEQLWDKVKDMLYDHHIDTLRNLVLFEDLPSDLKKSLNLILSSDLHHNRREMERELAIIGAFYDAPFFSGS